jgi:hypothetical protein
MVRDFNNQFQLFGGPTNSHGHKRGEMTEKKHWLKTAKRHRLFLEGIVSFLSTLSIAKREEVLRRAAEAAGKQFVSIDLAAGTGAKNISRHRLKMKPPGGLYVSREVDADETFLAEERAEGYPTTSAENLERKPKLEPEWAAKIPFLQTLGLVQKLDEIYPGDYADFLSAAFIVDILEKEDIREMFIRANRVLKTGGEFELTFPQSWQIAPEFLDALVQLGYEVTTPMRARQKMTEAWRRKIIETDGIDIADAACRMREKPFTILRLRKKQTIDPESTAVKNIPADVFDLIKTETGQRGATNGQHPYHYDPEPHLRRWEILKVF